MNSVGKTASPRSLKDKPREMVTDSKEAATSPSHRELGTAREGQAQRTMTGELGIPQLLQNGDFKKGLFSLD